LELKDAFICGLLHDIGEIIENQYFNREFRQAVHIANSIAKSINLGSAGDPFVPQINYGCWNSLNIPIENLPKICEEIRISTREIYASIF
tara:strand:- start:4639 stop:4908 length:270 start_codon:yes stop_codon:yes gene_type:complete